MRVKDIPYGANHIRIAGDHFSIPRICPKCSNSTRMKVAIVQNNCQCDDTSLIDISKMPSYDEEWALAHYFAILSRRLTIYPQVEVFVQDRYLPLAKKFFQIVNTAFAIEIFYEGTNTTINDKNKRYIDAHKFILRFYHAIDFVKSEGKQEQFTGKDAPFNTV